MSQRRNAQIVPRRVVESRTFLARNATPWRRCPYQNEMQPSSTGWFGRQASNAEDPVMIAGPCAAARWRGEPFPPSPRLAVANDGSGFRDEYACVTRRSEAY